MVYMQLRRTQREHIIYNNRGMERFRAKPDMELWRKTPLIYHKMLCAEFGTPPSQTLDRIT